MFDAARKLSRRTGALPCPPSCVDTADGRQNSSSLTWMCAVEASNLELGGPFARLGVLRIPMRQKMSPGVGRSIGWTPTRRSPPAGRLCPGETQVRGFPQWTARGLSHAADGLAAFDGVFGCDWIRGFAFPLADIFSMNVVGNRD